MQNGFTENEKALLIKNVEKEDKHNYDVKLSYAFTHLSLSISCRTIYRTLSLFSGTVPDD